MSLNSLFFSEYILISLSPKKLYISLLSLKSEKFSILISLNIIRIPLFCILILLLFFSLYEFYTNIFLFYLSIMIHLLY